MCIRDRGDPIEAHALAAVLGEGRTEANPLVIGSVKSNLGHLESAAGIAGLIKAVLSLEKEEIPAHLHFHKLNPHIDWAGMPMQIPSTVQPWPRGRNRRIASVSAFGFSGTNAHVVLEEAPAASVRSAPERPLHLLALSGRCLLYTSVVSGYEEELGQVEQRLLQAGVRVKRLAVSHGFHSPQMAEIEEAWERKVAEVSFHKPQLEMISSVTGRAVRGEELSQASYWREQVRQPVRFAAAMEEVLSLIHI